jgi:type IV pilus assembly protein PilV
MSTHPKRRGRTSRVQRGITMVESMVALVVLGTGMLGIASLYVASLKAERNALTRTTAVNLVNDMLDRIRANGVARDAYDTSKYGTGGPKDQKCVANSDATANCSTTQLAEDDLYRWIQAVKDPKLGLPGGPTATVAVTLAAAAGQSDRFQVFVTWQEAGEEQPFRYEVNTQIIPVAP